MVLLKYEEVIEKGAADQVPKGYTFHHGIHENIYYAVYYKTSEREGVTTKDLLVGKNNIRVERITTKDKSLAEDWLNKTIGLTW